MSEAVSIAQADGDNNPQPSPKINDFGVAVWQSVIEDMKGRDAFGTLKYGTPLQPFNGRDFMVDAYQEALDLAVYLKQGLIERHCIDGKGHVWVEGEGVEWCAKCPLVL